MYLEIYPDVVFVLNLIVDFMLLLLVKIIVHKKCSVLRLLSAAVIGGATAAFINLLPWFNDILKGNAITTLLRVIGFLIKPVSLVWMIRAAFGKMKGIELTRYSIIFFLITCFAGGFLNSIYYHTRLRLTLIQLDYSVIFSNLPMGYIVLTFLGFIPAAVLLVRLRKKYLGSKKDIYDIELICEGKSVRAKGFLDTGNCLFDPISRKPVIIVEQQVMEQLIPPECHQLLQASEAQNLQYNSPVSSELPDNYILRFHLIPYQSIGKDQGIMPGIVMDRMQIKVGEETCCQERVTAAVYNHTLSSGGDYQVILHKGLLEGK